mgnify:CR=1 FL=1
MSKNVSKHLLTKHGRFPKFFFLLGCSTSLQSILDDEINSYERPTGVKKCYRGKEDDLIFVVERVWEETLPSLSALLWKWWTCARDIILLQAAYYRHKKAFSAGLFLTRPNWNYRASHRHRRVTGSNPVEVLTFSGVYTQLLKLRS